MLSVEPRKSIVALGDARRTARASERGWNRYAEPKYHYFQLLVGISDRACRIRLQKSSCRFKRRHPERWPSGLRRTLGKRVCGKPYRGFESRSLRQHSCCWSIGEVGPECVE